MGLYSYLCLPFYVSVHIHPISAQPEELPIRWLEETDSSTLQSNGPCPTDAELLTELQVETPHAENVGPENI